MADTLDYNLAYYNLTQERVNQLAIDQERYLFVEFSYSNEMVKNIYHDKDRQKFIFKIEFTNITKGNVYLVKKTFYPEALYDYVTLDLNDEFYNFYLENRFNPKYNKIDLRAIWYFVMNDRTVPFFIKYVRDNKYIFSYKKMCEYTDHPVRDKGDIQITCKNLGLIKDNVTNMWLCPNHFPKK